MKKKSSIKGRLQREKEDENFLPKIYMKCPLELKFEVKVGLSGIIRYNEMHICIKSEINYLI